MDLLQEARDIINEVDSQMADLFVQRMGAAQMVAQYKQANGMPILDAAREEVVIRNGSARVEDENLRSYYIDFMRDTMALSRRYQQQLLGEWTAVEGNGDVVIVPLKNSYPITIRRGSLAQAGN